MVGGDGRRDGADEGSFIHRFGEIGRGPKCSRALFGAGFIVAGDDHGREMDVLCCELPEHIQSAFAWHVDIEHEAIRGMIGERGKEIAGGFVVVHHELVGAHQPAQRLAHLRLVIEHSDRWCGEWHMPISPEERVIGY